jgi:hypothetical protein
MRLSIPVGLFHIRLRNTLCEALGTLCLQTSMGSAEAATLAADTYFMVIGLEPGNI